MPESPRHHGSARRLAEAQERFIDVWGRMGSAWGIPRTMAEVHALLYITGQALSTDDVIGRLHISRGNASMTLRALEDWGIVSRMHQRGDRKEYFRAEQDVWKLFRTILRERKKREIDPLLEALHACRQLTDVAQTRTVDAETSTIADHNERLDEMLEFIETVDTLSQRFISPNGKGLRTAAKLLARVS